MKKPEKQLRKGDNRPTGTGEHVLKEIPLEEIKEHGNVRTNYNGIEELAESIRIHGLLQPIVVTPNNDGTYRVIYGHRRYRACQYLRENNHLSGGTIRAIVRPPVSDISTTQLIENIQRENLSPADLEREVSALIERDDLTQEQAAERLGKSQAWIAAIIKADEIRENYQTSDNLTDEEKTQANKLSSNVLAELRGLEGKQLDQAIKKTIKQGGTVKGAREVRKELRTPPVKPLQTAQEGPGKAERKGPEEGTGKRHHVIIDGFQNLAGDPVRDQVIKKLLADLSPAERELVRQIVKTWGNQR